MNQQNKENEIFDEEVAPIPMPISMIREMAMPKYGNRFCESQAARSIKYDCFYFYKHISRPLIATPKEVDGNEQSF